MYRKIKLFSVFIAVAFIVQLIAIVFFTVPGVKALFPLVMRINSEKLDTNNNSYIEYYNQRDLFDNKNLFIIGINENFSESYDVALDLLKFIKQNTNVTKILIERGKTETEFINKCIASSNIDDFTKYMDELRLCCKESDDFYKFIENLYKLNHVLPPLRKITAVGIAHSDNGVNSQYSDIHSADHKTAENICSALNMYPENSAFAIINSERTKYGREFYSCVKDQIALKIPTLMTEIKYSRCQSAADGQTVNEIAFPFSGSENACEVRIIGRRNIEWFINYYEFVADTFNLNPDEKSVHSLDIFTPDIFFVMSCASPVIFSDNNAAQALS